jgi:CheY-like chemotaxis protein
MGKDDIMGSKINGLKTAWVVDSSEYFRRFESEYIAKATKHCEVEPVRIGNALERFKRGVYPDVLVIDILQPHIDGVLLVNKLKEERPEMDIIICSAEARNESSRLVGMTLISKPIVSMSGFMETVRGVVENV